MAVDWTLCCRDVIDVRIVVLTSARMAASDAGHRWPLASATARLLFLRAVCAVAEGADVPLSHTARHASSSRFPSPPGVCVRAVLGDVLRRVAVLGGREGLPRSLGSVYAGSVTRFLGGALRGVASRVIHADIPSHYNGLAVSPDGCTLLLVDSGYDRSHVIFEFSTADGSCSSVVGSGDDWLHFDDPWQVCIAPGDGFVFVAEHANHRVQVRTPCLNFHDFVGEGALKQPAGVCANADIVVVASLAGEHRIAVFSRSDGALLRRFASYGMARDQLKTPIQLCFMAGDRRHVAVADAGSDRVSVFSVDGEFIRHVGVGVLSDPHGVAVSAFDELVVADTGNRCLRVFSGTGDLLATVGDGHFTGVAVHGGTVFAVNSSSATEVVVFT